MQDLNDKVTGNSLTAAEWNEVPSEIQNVIEGLGIALSGSDLNQLGKAIAGYASHGTMLTDSGAAGAYVLSAQGNKQGFEAYANGAVVKFVAVNPNPGASTVNAFGLGVINIKLPGGVIDPTANMITDNAVNMLVYRTAPSAHFELVLGGASQVVISASGTYTPSAGVKYIRRRLKGAGGGGGGVDGQGASTGAAAGDGAPGGYIESLTYVDSGYSATVTIGAAGTGGAAGANDGTAGGDTIWNDGTALETAGGGGSGLGKTGVGGSTRFNNIPAIGGTATGGDINVPGENGQPGNAGDTNAHTSFSARGGPLGQGGLGAFANNSAADGNDAAGNGAGGSGGASQNVSTNAAGGAGSIGVVIVEEFF